MIHAIHISWPTRQKHRRFFSQAMFTATLSSRTAGAVPDTDPRGRKFHLRLISWKGCPWMGQMCSRHDERFLRQLCRWWISKSLQTFIGAKRVSHGFRGALNLIRGVNVVGSNLGFQWKSSDWMGKVIDLKFTNCLFCHCLRMLRSTCHAHQFFVMSFWLGACNRKALEVKH